MAKRKPDQVIEYRHSLQDKEREMFDSVVGAYQVDKISEAVDQALSFQNVYMGITLIEIATGKEILFGTPNDLNDLIADVRTWWAANKDEFGPGLWNFFRGIFERAPLTAAQEAAIQETATLYQQEAGVNPATGQAYTSVAQLWAQAFGVNLP
tara:strand:+ start:561 stop:1019 length:459 start_codon:yes stop_codon:yes gene_type:complete